ncbi:MAG: transposase [Gaiellaceae bacterium]
MAVTREGIPVRVSVWPGNTNDQTVIEQVKDDLRGWRLGRCVWVVDRGFSSDANLRYLTRGGGHWIAGERIRDGSPDAQAALARPGRYQSARAQPARQGRPPRRQRPLEAVRGLPQPGRGRP